MSNTDSNNNPLANHLAQFTTAPVLFIGSGLSRRYLGLETWSSLLERFAEDAEMPFQYYLSTAGQKLPKVASLIANSHRTAWWKEAKFESSRAKYKKYATSPTSTLKIEISAYLQSADIKFEELDQNLQEEIEALGASVIDAVITTNWDSLLERIFPDYSVFVGQDQLLFSSLQGVGEIYKVHGCASEPNSLVLCEEDYEQFNRRHPYLTAKLLTLFVEHPVIFVGYSLTDQNVHQILAEIGQCLSSEQLATLRNRLILVEWVPGQQSLKMENSLVTVGSGQVIPLLKVTTDSLLPVFTALNGLRRLFSAKTLRRLKEHVYALVRDNDPAGHLFVRDIEDTDAEELDVVLGVGAIRDYRGVGYRAYTRGDLIRDVLQSESSLDAERVVADTLPNLIRGAKYIPVFRYLRAAGYLDDTGGLVRSLLDAKLARFATHSRDEFAPPKHYRKRAAVINGVYQQFSDLVAAMPPRDVLLYAPLLDDGKIELEQLRQFLSENEKSLGKSENINDQTQFIKLVCLYDCLMFRCHIK